MRFKRVSEGLVGLSFCLMLVSCSSSGSSGSSNGPSIIGVAASGAPLANAAITVIDANGKTATATAGSDGSYSVAVDGKTPPFLIMAVGNAPDGTVSLYSVATDQPTSNSPTVANVTPITSVITAMAIGGDPSTVFDNNGSVTVNASAVASSATAVSSTIQQMVAASGTTLTAGLDLIKQTFKADGTGIDKVLDNIGSMTNMDSGSGGKTFIYNKSDDTQTISIDLSSRTVSGNMSPTLATTDGAGLHALAVALTSAYSNGDPALLSQVFDPAFLHNGNKKAYFTNSAWLARWKGATFSNPTIEVLPLGDNGAPMTLAAGRLLVTFGVTLANGNFETLSTIVKSAASGWVVYGNQSPYNVSVDPAAYRFQSFPTAANLSGSKNGLVVQTAGGVDFGVRRTDADGNDVVKSATIEVYLNGAWVPIDISSRPATYSKNNNSPYVGAPTTSYLNATGCANGNLNFGNPGIPGCSSKVLLTDNQIAQLPETGVSFRIKLYDQIQAGGNLLATRYTRTYARPPMSNTLAALPYPKPWATSTTVCDASCFESALAKMDGYSPFSVTWFNPSSSVKIGDIQPGMGGVPGLNVKGSAKDTVTGAPLVRPGATSYQITGWIDQNTGLPTTAPFTGTANRVLNINCIDTVRRIKYTAGFNNFKTDKPGGDAIAW